jgi:hypothetical protein
MSARRLTNRTTQGGRYSVTALFSMAAEQDVEIEDDLARGKSLFIFLLCTIPPMLPPLTMIDDWHNVMWQVVDCHFTPCNAPTYVRFRLFDAYHELFRLHTAQKRLRELKARISSQSKKNFVLERDVRYLDSRIALLIQNRMALDEVGTPESFV